MFSLSLKNSLVSSLLLLSCAKATADSITPFDQKAICGERKAGEKRFVDKKKFFATLIKTVNVADVITADGTINKDELFLRARKHLNDFKRDFLDKGEYYQPTPASISLEALVFEPASYKIECLEPAATLGAEVRERVDEATKQVSSKLLAGKDLDALTKPLSARSPAKFSITRDKVADNTAFQTEYAVAGVFDHHVAVKDALHTGGKDHTIFMAFYPFITSQTTTNSNVKLKDIDKTTAGLMFDAFSVPFFGLGTNHFSFRGGYQVDSTKSYEAAAGELAWWPQFGIFQALKFGERMDFGGPQGVGSVLTQCRRMISA